jgi:uncharacterized membrane protein
MTTIEQNVRAIKAWEQQLQRSRSPLERFSDWITSKASRAPVLIGHVIWFAAWLAINLGVGTDITPFDPFPFPLLTMVVSLEAIFLALFVLSSQNRLSRQADARAQLDLQIDLLAEREMTVVLRLLQDIAAHLDVRNTLTSDQIRDLSSFTDLRRLTERIDHLDR